MPGTVSLSVFSSHNEWFDKLTTSGHTVRSLTLSLSKGPAVGREACSEKYEEELLAWIMRVSTVTLTVRSSRTTRIS